MPSLISKLSKTETQRLFKDIYYLNMGEFREFCDKHSIPYTILVETKDGKIKKSRDKDRQKIIIERVLYYLKTGKIIPATLFRKEVVNLSGLPKNVTEEDRLYYGCYEKKNPKMIALLKKLTGGEFKNGAVARVLCRKFWADGKAPTFTEYAKAWLKARDDYSLGQHPEAAYLTDRSNGKNKKNWKELRVNKAKRIIEILEKIDPV
ncbi:MAG: hypothetical protein HKN25_03900 [Pyrinomonadaceae bacterium]|nr:hypothetical protein [Pyrinomonadaceae bacterium]